MTLKCPVFGVNYTTAGKAEVADYLIRNSRELSGQYVCFSNVHTTVMAADDEGYRDVLNASAFTFPDGTPVADMIWKQGYIEAERVAGPDLMAELFRRCLGNHKKHYFYGSTEETLSALSDKLKKNYPWMEIAGMYSPPFRPLTEEEDAEVVKMINDSGADFVWIGLGAPKQELWMAEHKGRIKGLMLGVGAGFDFHAGRVKRAPVIVQKLGMEWFYRLMQDPKRLLKRYFITNTKFIIYSHIKYRGK
ncbi:MAG: WecB/TagA/CpsF family glycosyltransferase [Lachnospiraceae bacterium]|nr:WecB/TagA/CpsF family glycosyltransferase [Lachnospiraceae bacterium]